jgi:hypothetical protein
MRFLAPTRARCSLRGGIWDVGCGSIIQLLDAVLLILGTIKHALSSAGDPSVDNAASAVVAAAAAAAVATEVQVRAMAALGVLVHEDGCVCV